MNVQAAALAAQLAVLTQQASDAYATQDDARMAAIERESDRVFQAWREAR